MNEHIFIVLVSIALISFASQWIAWRIKLPSILFLLLAGIIAGPVTGWFHPDEVFGHLLMPMINLSVAVILFEGSLTLKMHEIRGHGAIVFNLVTVGLLTTAILITLCSHWLIGLHWPIAAMFGAITAVSGPTVIVPMLRAIRPSSNVANILRWEGTLIDPIGALLAILVFVGITASQDNTAIPMIIWHCLTTLALGGAIGVVAALFLAVLIKKQWLPEYLKNIATLAIVFTAFGIADIMIGGAGLFAVTVMGVLLANLPDVHMDEIVGFKESLSLLLISVLFIVLAARIEPAHLDDIGLPVIGLLLLIQFVIRPASVFLSTFGKKSINWREKILLSWIMPRGIIAAAIAAFFSFQLEQVHLADSTVTKQLVLLTFLVIIGTVVFQSLTARFVARLLRIAEPEARGFLIIGANPAAIAIAKSLQTFHYQVVLTSTNWHNTSLARMEGIPCYYGNPVSEHAERHLELVGIGGLMAMSREDDLNVLACVKYRREFGRDNVFKLAPHNTRPKQHQIAEKYKSRLLWDTTLTFQKLQDLFAAGATVKHTQLTDAFTYEKFQKKNPNHIPLFAIDPRGCLKMVTPETNIAPQPEWTLISLVAEKP